MNTKTALRPLLILLAAVALPAAAHAEVLAHWTFDELVAEGHAFADAHGTQRAVVTDQSAATLDHSKDVPFGKAVSLGPGGNGLSIPPVPGIYEHSFTIAAWVKLDNAKEHNLLLADWSKPYAYAFGFDNNKIICYLRHEKPDKKGNTTDIINSKALNVPITAGAWHHVAWVWDRTGPKAGKLTVYLDGHMDGETNATGKVPTIVVNNNRPASIGYKADTKNAFHGSVDELWVFSDNLSAEQINNLMKSNDINSSQMLANAGPAAAEKPAPEPTPTPAAPTPPSTPTTPAPTPASTSTPPAPTTPTPAATDHTPTTPPTDSGPVAFSTAPHNTPAPGKTTTPTPAPTPTDAPKAPTLTFSSPTFTVKPGTTGTASSPTSEAPPAVAAVTPHHYTPARVLGIIASGTMCLMLSAFLFWATNERGKMRHARR